MWILEKVLAAFTYLMDALIIEQRNNVLSHFDRDPAQWSQLRQNLFYIIFLFGTYHYQMYVYIYPYAQHGSNMKHT